jgi:outer membrane usher protein
MALRTGQLSSLMLLTFVTSATAVNAQEADDALPPPPDASAVNARSLYHLALVINHYDTRQVLPVVQREGNYFMSSADL